MEHVNDVEKVKAVGNTAMVPIVKLNKSDADKRGSVQVITPDGLPAHITTEPCDESTHEDEYKLTEHLYQGRSKHRSNRQKIKCALYSAHGTANYSALPPRYLQSSISVASIVVSISSSHHFVAMSVLQQ